MLTLTLGIHRGIVSPCTSCALALIDCRFEYSADGETLLDSCWHCARERKLCVYPGKRTTGRGIRRRRIEEGQASTSRVRIEDDPVFLGEECRVVEITADDGRTYELKYKMTLKQS